MGETVTPSYGETVTLPLIMYIKTSCSYQPPSVDNSTTSTNRKTEKYGNDNNSDTNSREIMTAKRDRPDGQQSTPKPSLTGDRRLDKALEKLRRTLEAKKEATKQSAPANGRAEHG
jgi:hypothetical protein